MVIKYSSPHKDLNIKIYYYVITKKNA